MWYLYTAIGTRTCLQKSPAEEDIALELESWIEKDPEMWFLIVHYDEITTEPQSWLIRSDKDYAGYLEGYYQRIMKNKTCMELKKEMMDIVYGEEPKVKKR